MGSRLELEQSSDWNSEDVNLISQKVEYDDFVKDYITLREWTT